MWRSSRASDSADPLRRSLKHASVTDLIGYIGEGLPQHVRLFWRLSTLEQRVLIFILEIAIGFIVCAGAILAMFAWTGAPL
jgi:hypothetical protein